MPDFMIFKQLLHAPVEKYATVTEAIQVIADARQYQTRMAWLNAAKADAGSRSTEEWIVLLHRYINKLDEVYAESDGETVEGRARMTKYAGIIANLALWLVQATAGLSNADKLAELVAVKADAGASPDAPSAPSGFGPLDS